MTQGPILIDLDGETPVSPAEAPPVPDPGLHADPPTGRAMQAAAQVAAPVSRLARWFWRLAGALVMALVSLAAWDYSMALIQRVPLLGWAVSGLMAALLALALGLGLREWAAIRRLARIDRVQAQVRAAMAGGTLADARRATAAVRAIYATRADLAWGRDRFDSRAPEVLDADAVFTLAEAELLAPLDAQASHVVEAAARQVAMVTAIVPLPLADVAAALTANLRMIRQVAEIYGGRAGTFGSWRLMRAVMGHVLATGAVAVGDDMLGSLLGGGLLAKLSRRFGEGLVNGALTARVGLAAMEVCRPMPFSPARRPSVSGTVKRALTGLFGS